MDPRRPTDDEWNEISGLFPSLYRPDCWITGEPTKAYNCIAFSIGSTNRWIKPDSPLADFQKQYNGFGYQPVVTSTATVDGWGIAPDGAKMTHGSRKAVDPGFRALGLWESKCGSMWQLTHGRKGLNSPTVYGQVLTSFLKSTLDGAEGQMPQLPEMEPELTGEELSRLSDQAVAQVGDAGLIGQFAVRRERFLTAIGRSVYSDTAAFTALPEFADLVALGSGIVPLVVAQLGEEEGFFLLEVLDALEPGLTAIDYDPLSGQQSLARLVARAWLAR